jgi:hypothetical protein
VHAISPVLAPPRPAPPPTPCSALLRVIIDLHAIDAVARFLALSDANDGPLRRAAFFAVLDGDSVAADSWVALDARLRSTRRVDKPFGSAVVAARFCDAGDANKVFHCTWMHLCTLLHTTDRPMPFFQAGFDEFKRLGVARVVNLETQHRLPSGSELAPILGELASSECVTHRVAAVVKEALLNAMLEPPLPRATLLGGFGVCIALHPHVADFVNEKAADELRSERKVAEQQFSATVSGGDAADAAGHERALLAWERHHGMYLAKRTITLIKGDLVVVLVDCCNGLLKAGDRVIVERFGQNRKAVQVRKEGFNDWLSVGLVVEKHAGLDVTFIPFARGRCLVLRAAQRQYATQPRVFLTKQAPRPGELLRVLTRARMDPLLFWIQEAGSQGLEFADCDSALPDEALLCRWPAKGPRSIEMTPVNQPSSVAAVASGMPRAPVSYAHARGAVVAAAGAKGCEVEEDDEELDVGFIFDDDHNEDPSSSP